MQLLSFKDLYKRWGITKRTLETWRQQGKIPKIYRSGPTERARRFFKLEDVLEFEEKHNILVRE